MGSGTKEAIAQAFLQVVQEKSVDKVTVKDVVTRCGITRQTFYYHYQDLLEVIESIVAERIEELLEETLSQETPRDAIRVLLSTLEERPDLIASLLGSRKSEDLERIFLKASRTYFAELMRRTKVMPRVKYASDMETALTFYSSAIVGVLIEASSKPGLDLDILTDQLLRLLRGEFCPWPEQSI